MGSFLWTPRGDKGWEALPWAIVLHSQVGGWTTASGAGGPVLPCGPASPATLQTRPGQFHPPHSRVSA